MTHLQRTFNLWLSEQLHIVSNSLEKAILSINLFGIINLQSTRMHNKEHIRKTKFLPVHNECRLPLAIRGNPIKTDQVLEAKNIGHCPFSEPNSKIITKNLTFLGDTKSTVIT
jgi:hypothetical protein